MMYADQHNILGSMTGEVAINLKEKNWCVFGKKSKRCLLRTGKQKSAFYAGQSNYCWACRIESSIQAGDVYGGIMIRILLQESNQRKMDVAYILATSLMACMLMSGCTINRVSLLTRQPTGTSVKASEVQLFSSFKDISQPWQLEGMISAYTLPIMSNTTDKREALIKETIASLGINALVGLQPRLGEGIKATDRSVGILAKVGGMQQNNFSPLPKFVVCLPAVNFRLRKIHP